MFGALIFIVFFALFTVASILMPIQFFPGNLIEKWLNIPEEYGNYVSAVINGLVYSTTTWLVFLIISKKITEE